jgi:hypothetical protein
MAKASTKPKIKVENGWANIEFGPLFYVGIQVGDLPEALESYDKYKDVMTVDLLSHHLTGQVQVDGQWFEIYTFILKYKKDGTYSSVMRAFKVDRSK